MSEFETYAVGEAPRRTCDMAMFSLAAGILSYFFLPVIGAIGAIITGHMALREIHRSRGRLSGRGMAVGGLILGYVQVIGAIVLAFLAIMAFVLFGIAVAGSEVTVDGDRVEMKGPGGTRIEVDDHEGVRVSAPGTRIEVNDEAVWIQGPRRMKFHANHEGAQWKGLDKSPVCEKRARIDMATLRTALTRYRADMGAYPGTEVGLLALRGDPGEGETRRWKGPYIDAIPVDPWGRLYRYRSGGEGKMTLHSLGPDGVPSEDDIR
ncbi:MAG: type II secretion system protein GspG [Planctomycetota bacterium]|jgi:type II secretion system protein G